MIVYVINSLLFSYFLTGVFVRTTEGAAVSRVLPR